MLAQQVRETVLDYLRTTFHLSDAAFENQLFEFLDGPGGMFCGPYADVRLPFRKADRDDSIPLQIQPNFVPHAHQVKSFYRLSSQPGYQPLHTLVVTGTGSGKTECFLYPVLDHCYRTRHQPGIKAILLYPMNALASDQARRLATLLWDDERLKGQVTAGLYVGGKGAHKKADRLHLVDDKLRLREEPPNILLTNYKMLDFLLLRPDDRKLWQQNATDTLRYLVLDELHTYDGAQGSDVACLIRRLKARLKTAVGGLCAVGTSATVGSGGTRESAKTLREFATKVFGETFDPYSVIEEERQDLEEALPLDLDAAQPAFPSPTPDELDASTYASSEAYLAEQLRLWFGKGDLTQLEVGDRLKSHRFLRAILQGTAGQLLTLEQLAKAVSRFHQELAEAPAALQSLLLQSFLSTVSYARKPTANGESEPFLACQAQLWVRELRKLTLNLHDDHLRWHEAGGNVREPQLPLLTCRDCGVTFWRRCSARRTIAW